MQSLGKMATITKQKDKGKNIMVSKKKDSPPGSIIHVIEENEEEPDSINPNQFQKMAKTTYESHLKKIEVILQDSFWNYILEIMSFDLDLNILLYRSERLHLCPWCLFII